MGDHRLTRTVAVTGGESGLHQHRTVFPIEPLFRRKLRSGRTADPRARWSLPEGRAPIPCHQRLTRPPNHSPAPHPSGSTAAKLLPGGTRVAVMVKPRCCRP
jgi:hypothetical protein